MDFDLSFRNVTAFEASLIFASLSSALTAPKDQVAKPHTVTKEQVEKAVKTVTEASNQKKEETPAPQPEPEEEVVTTVNEPKKVKKKAPAPQPEPEEEIEEAVTVDTLKARAHKLVKADKANSPKIVALLKKAGAESIPKLKPEFYAGFNKALDKLEPKVEPETDEELRF